MLDNLTAFTSQNKTQNYLFSSSPSIFYLTKAPFEGFSLLILSGQPYVICSQMIKEQVETYFSGAGGVQIRANNVPIDEICTILSQRAEQTLIFDSLDTPTADFFELKSRLESLKIELLPQKGILTELRAVKTPDEIKNISIACDIVSKTAQTIQGELKAGLSELDIHFRIIELFAKHHSIVSFTPIVAAGPNSANPHHASSNYKLKPDDMVLIDIGCKYGGFCSDLTRTYFLEGINTDKVDDVRTNVWKIVKNSHDIVINQIKAGLPINWADKTARDVIAEAGYKDNFIHNTGHGVGIEIHETPSLNLRAEGIFLPKMVVTVEPGIYLKGRFGVRIEDTILITKDGCEVLTSAPY